MESLRRNVNTGVLQQILDCFVEITGIRVAFFDDFREIVNGKGKPACGFCASVKQIPALAAGCEASDRQAYEKAAGLKSIYIYQCHMGFWEAVVPLTIRGRAAGYLMFGQIRDSETGGARWAAIEKKLIGLGLPPETIQSMQRSYDEVSTLSYEKVRAIAKMLDIIARHIMDTDVIHFYDTETIVKAKAFIGQRINTAVTTKAVAGAVGLSPSHMGYLFKRETGETVSAYVADMRLRQAKRLLDETSRSIKEIAFDCGYADQNYFSRVFKKLTGMSPAEYRSLSRERQTSP